MNRINELFSRKRHDILSLYFCAGSPTLEGTATVIKTESSFRMQLPRLYEME